MDSLRDKQQPHHYFASSPCDWRCSENLRDLIAMMKELGQPYKVYSVPLPISSGYRIENFRPVVEGGVSEVMT